MQRQVRSLQLVKCLLYHEDPEILAKATDFFNEALAGRISFSTPRRSRDGSDYHIIFHFTVEERGSVTSTPAARNPSREARTGTPTGARAQTVASTGSSTIRMASSSTSPSAPWLSPATEYRIHASEKVSP